MAAPHFNYLPSLDQHVGCPNSRLPPCQESCGTFSLASLHGVLGRHVLKASQRQDKHCLHFTGIPRHPCRKQMKSFHWVTAGGLIGKISWNYAMGSVSGPVITTGPAFQRNSSCGETTFHGHGHLQRDPVPDPPLLPPTAQSSPWVEGLTRWQRADPQCSCAAPTHRAWEPLQEASVVCHSCVLSGSKFYHCEFSSPRVLHVHIQVGLWEAVLWKRASLSC